MDSLQSGFTEPQWQSVHNVCLRRLRDWHLAEEAAQAVFLLALRKGKVNAAGADHSRWLLCAAAWVCREVQRGERRRRHHESEAGQNHATLQSIRNTPAPDFEADLNGALDSLSSSDRSLLRQRFFEKKPYRSIGQDLGLSEAAVEKRVSRALVRMREQLQRNGFDLAGNALPLLLCAGFSAGTGGVHLPAYLRFSPYSQSIARNVARVLSVKQTAILTTVAAVLVLLLTFHPNFGLLPRPRAPVALPHSLELVAQPDSTAKQPTLRDETADCAPTHAPVAQPPVIAEQAGTATLPAAPDESTIALSQAAQLPPPAAMTITPTVARHPADEDDTVIAAAAAGSSNMSAKPPAGSAALAAQRPHGVIVKSIEVCTDVSGGSARSELTFTFENHSAAAMEFSFLFSLPEHAAADRFALSGGSDASSGAWLNGTAGYAADARSQYLDIQNARFPDLPLGAVSTVNRGSGWNSRTLSVARAQVQPAHKPLESWGAAEPRARESAELLIAAELPAYMPSRKWRRLLPPSENPLAGVLESASANLYRLTLSAIPPGGTRWAVVACIHPLETAGTGAELRAIYRFPLFHLNRLNFAPFVHFHGTFRDVETGAALRAPAGATLTRVGDATIVDGVLAAVQDDCGEINVAFRGTLSRMLGSGHCAMQLDRAEARAGSNDRFSMTLPPLMAAAPGGQRLATQLQQAQLTVTASDGSVLKLAGQAPDTLDLQHSATFYGVCSAAGPVTIALTGVLDGTVFRREWRALCPASAARNENIATLFAEAQQSLPPDRTAEANQAALQQAIVTPHVAFVVNDAVPLPTAPAWSWPIAPERDSSPAELIEANLAR